MARRVPAVLSIAGSDSGGGAGIQADLKAFARCGVHGMTAITAITAQNTRAVERVEPVSPHMVFCQMLAIAEDMGADAIKIGMLGSPEAIDAVAVGLTYMGLAFKPVVIDPVMVAESGAPLIDEETKAALVDVLFARSTVVTPNIPEARELTGLGKGASQEELARAVFELGLSSSPVATARISSTSSSTASGWSRFPASGTPTAPPTGPAALTLRRWLHSSPAARSRWRQLVRRAQWRRKLSPTDFGRSAAEPGPSMSSA